MSVKLEQKEYPAGHSKEDFECFGPPATKDGQFDGTMICDMGCFTQDNKDTNKYYSAAVVQSKKDQSWWVYFEWGRQGATNPTFQFLKCDSKAEAQNRYKSQLMSKNWQRGQVINHPVLGQILQAKSGKDCYLVRPQATRSTGLPSAKTIAQNEGAKVRTITHQSQSVDIPTLTLMRDLNIGTINFTRDAMQGGALPTQFAIDEGKKICFEAQKRILKVGDNLDDQIVDKEINEMTRLMYSRIPKAKARNAAPKEWLLTQDNIAKWLLDLDAYESALYASNISQPQSDPFGGMKIKMCHLTEKESKFQFINNWLPEATRNNSGVKGRIKIINLWEIDREGDIERLTVAQNKIAAKSFNIAERPLFQPMGFVRKRPDLTEQERDLFEKSHTCFGFHGTRSINVSGILRTSWRLPDNLVGVKITAWMFGCGIYWGDDWGKSAGYTSYEKARYTQGEGGVYGRGAFMFIADVALGSPYVASKAEVFVKAPSGYHSVCGKSGYTKGRHGPLANNEFITYDSAQCRARYLIEFGITAR